jgi:Holliday junction resolvase RusA-like endonuclease
MIVAEFVVPGEAVPKGRARFSTRGGSVRTFTPPETRNFEALIRLAAREAMKGQPPSEGALLLHLEVRVLPPASWSARRRRAAVAGEIVPTRKPDLSNILKAVEDAMNQVVYVDDSQLVDSIQSKRFSGSPGVSVRVLLLGVQAAPR